MSLPENRFYTGTVARGFEHFMRLRLSSEEFVSLILGEVPPHGDARISYHSDRRLYQLIFPRSTRWEREVFWVDPKNLRVVEISKTDAVRGREIRVSFSRFTKKSSTTVPMEIQIEIPGIQSQMGLSFRKVEINRHLAPELFRLSVPGGVEVVDLEDDSKPFFLEDPEH
jgi:hypothetical protein